MIFKAYFVKDHFFITCDGGVARNYSIVLPVAELESVWVDVDYDEHYIVTSILDPLCTAKSKQSLINKIKEEYPEHLI